MTIWREHLPALLLALPLLGAFAAPVAGHFGSRARNVWFVGITALTALVAWGLWQQVSASGIVVYVMGAEHSRLTLPSGMALPVRTAART